MKDIIKDTRISIDKKYFDEGQSSYAFRIRDIGRKINMVGKIDKDIFNGENKNKSGRNSAFD